MKNTLCIIVLLSISITNRLTAQVKKPVAKPVAKQLAKPVEKNTLSRIDFFNKNADDAVEILRDELKKLKIDLNDMDEEDVYSFNSASIDKDPSNTQTEKTLTFTGDLIAYVKASKSNVVNKLTFFPTQLTHYTAIKSMLGVDKMIEINGGYNDTTLRSGDIFVNLSSSEDYDDDDKVVTSYTITAERIDHNATQLSDLAQSFDVSDMDMHRSYTDVTNAALNFVKRQGYTFYYQSPNSFRTDDNDKCTEIYYSAYFNKHVSVTFTLNKLWLVNTILISSADPIAFNKLKKAFELSEWKKIKAPGSNSDVNNYTNKNVTCEVDGKYHTIQFTISPAANDISTRFVLAPTPGLTQIIGLRNYGSADEVAKALAKDYLTDIKYDEAKKEYVYDESADDFQFFYKSPQGTTVRTYFKMDLTTDWTAPCMVYSDDKTYLQALSDEFEKSTELKKKYTKGLKDGYFALYDISMEATREAKAEEQRRAAAEQQRAEEARAAAERERARLAEIEKQRLQAEKDAKFNESLRKATEIMQKMIKN